MDIALLLGRLLFGLGIAGHGFQKLLGWFGGPGLTGVTPIFEKFGFRPGRPFAIMASLGEISGGTLLVLGLLGPVGPALTVLVMLVASFSVTKNGFFVSRNGIELPALYATGGLLLLVTGPGAVSLDRLLGLMNVYSERDKFIALGLAILAAFANLALRRSPSQPQN
jgi:putative oxidoreductase